MKTSDVERNSISWRHHDSLRFTSLNNSLDLCKWDGMQFFAQQRRASLMGACLLRYGYFYVEMAFQTWAWWRHQMETSSALLSLCAGNSPVTDEFPLQRTVTRSFDVFFHLCLNKRLSKQSWGWWFETPSCSLWRHCNGSWVLCAAIMIDTFTASSHGPDGRQCVAVIILNGWNHYSDVKMGAMASQITRLTIVYSTVYSGVDQRKHQSSTKLHRWQVNYPHKGLVTRKMFPFDDVIAWYYNW